jgi:hypothetical protein
MSNVEIRMTKRGKISVLAIRHLVIRISFVIRISTFVIPRQMIPDFENPACVGRQPMNCSCPSEPYNSVDDPGPHAAGHLTKRSGI